MKRRNTSESEVRPLARRHLALPETREGQGVPGTFLSPDRRLEPTAARKLSPCVTQGGSSAPRLPTPPVQLSNECALSMGANLMKYTQRVPTTAALPETDWPHGQADSE